MTVDKKELRDAQEGPTVEELKERFKAGSIPLQTDFANLIDVAEHGRTAVGKSKGQTGPANGFTLSSMGRLELKLNASGGLTVDANGIGIKGLYGVNIDDSGLSVKTIANYGIGANSDGIWVKTNNNKGVTVDKDGLSVIANNTHGIHIDQFGVGVKLYPNYGLEHNDSGLWVKVNKDKGLEVDKDGIGLKKEQTFQKGMVMMHPVFDMSEGNIWDAPEGWAICDGENGTPDMRMYMVSPDTEGMQGESYVLMYMMKL